MPTTSIVKMDDRANILQRFTPKHSNNDWCINVDSMKKEKPAEVYDLIETMASNNYNRGSDYIKKWARILDVDEVTSLKAQVTAMQKQIAKISVNVV